MTTSREMVNSCVCTRLRAAARVVERRYDEILRPAGLNASQLGILAAIDAAPMASIAALSKQLRIDRTTLSRNLRPLERAGLVKLGAEGWKRSRTVEVTHAGSERLKAATSLWQAAQDGFLGRFGRSEWKRVDHELRTISSLF